MNRFESRTIEDSSSISKRIVRLVPLVLGLIIIVIFLAGVKYISTSSQDKQLESLNNALTRDIAECYAIEGIYPPSLEYIESHYGLTYDKSMFFVDYQAIGSNLYPDITVLCISKEE